MIEKEEIVRALTLWFQPGDVFEIRALKAITSARPFEHTESGYFDYEHIRAAADAIGQIRFSAGVYVTINPVKHDLLARAVNKIRYQKDVPTTADSNILRRKWLLIDCDPVRESGIASSDEEHNAAIVKAAEIRDALTANGWPSPILIDSGNGAHLTYRIDLPADDGGLVQRVLNTLKEASSEQVDVDVSVFNPARIVRVPGTMNCKGDDADGKACGRPHRVSKILDTPATLSVVTESQLREFIGEEIVQASESSDYAEANGFDIDSWIAKYAPDAGTPVPYKDGRKWTFKVCPFNPEHTNRSAVITESADGAIGFRCLHNSCTGNDWRKFRVLREPGCYDRKVPDDVNIDGIMEQSSKSAVEIIIPTEPEIIRPWRDVSNSDIRSMLCETYLGELTNIYSSVTRPPLPLEAALLKAIVTIACCLTGEASTDELQRRYGMLAGMRLTGPDRAKLKIDTAGGQVCNVYAMLVANSASGKDIGSLIGKFVRMHNPDIQRYSESKTPADWNLGTACSAEGLAKLLSFKPNGLLSISEMKNWLDPKHWQSGATSFLTEAFGQGFFDQNFSDRGRNASSRTVDYCCPSIIANIQPNVFGELVNMQDIYTGFLGRFIFAIMPEYYGNPARFNSIAVMEQIRAIADVFLRKKGIVELEEDYSDSLQKIFLGNCDPKLNPSWRRLCCEYYPRFMVMLSVTKDISSQGENVILTDDTRTKAKKLIMWFFANAEKILSEVMDCNDKSRDLESKLKRLFEIVRDQDRGDGVLTRTISHYATGTGTTGGDRAKLLAELVERGWIINENGKYKVFNPPLGMEKVHVRKKK